MTLLRRRPREVYRVYSEDEYLDGAGSELRDRGRVAGGRRLDAVPEPARQVVTRAPSAPRGRRGDAGREPWARSAAWSA